MRTVFLGNIAIFLACCIMFAGCSSIPSYNFKVSQTVVRSAIQENNSPRELNNKALVLFFTQDKKQENIKIKHKIKDDYGETVVDKDSFAAFIVAPGVYAVNSTENTFEENKCYFFVVKDKKVSPIAANIFQEQCAKKFLVKKCSYFGDVRDVSSYFSNKVSGGEVFLHNTKVVFFSIGVAIVVVVLCAGFFYIFLFTVKHSQPEQTVIINNNSSISPNAYGPGVHADPHGRPVKTVPVY